MDIIIKNIKVSPIHSANCLLNIPHLKLKASELTGIWGPSGSGKSTLINCINGLNFFDKRFRVEGSIRFETPDKFREIQKDINYLNVQNSIGVFTILQFLYEGLSPLHTLGTSLFDGVKQKYATRELFNVAVNQQIEELGLPPDTLHRYPDMLSGGEIQRCHLLTAMLSDVSFLLLDEVTSALDRDNSLMLFNKIEKLKFERGCGGLFISHDRELLERYADRILLMDKGEIVNTQTDDIHNINLDFKQKYTINKPRNIVLQCSDISKAYSSPASDKKSKVTLLDSISLNINSSHFLGLCGPSGSGKSTLGKILAGLESPDTGSVLFEGKVDLEQTEIGLKRRHLACPFLFQDALQSFNPAYTIIDTIQKNIQEARSQNIFTSKNEVEETMVGLDLSEETLNLYPYQLSGGQAQRCQILMALIFKPKLLIMDEPFSFLDPATISKTLNFLYDKREQEGLSLFCISHQTELLLPFCDEVIELSYGALTLKKMH